MQIVVLTCCTLLVAMTTQGVWGMTQDDKDLLARAAAAAAVGPTELKQIVAAATDGIDKVLRNITDEQLKTELREAKTSLAKDLKDTGKVTRAIAELASDDDDDDNNEDVRRGEKEPTKRQGFRYQSNPFKYGVSRGYKSPFSNFGLNNGRTFSTGRNNFGLSNVRTFDPRRFNLNLRRVLNAKQNKGIKTQFNIGKGWSLGLQGLKYKSPNNRFSFGVKPKLSGGFGTYIKFKF